MKPRFVDDWRDCWRWFSVHCMTLATAVQTTWLMLPPDLKTTLPDGLVNKVSIGLLVFGVIGRLVKQEKKDAGGTLQSPR